MSNPLVSIICLCYNHEKYVKETLVSVWKQTYRNIEVIIVDDASRDGSVGVIRQFLAGHPAEFSVKTIFLENNLGNCAAFNRGWRMASGKYVIDLATDDIMLPERIEKQVTYFESLPDDYGVVFTESQYIDEKGHRLHFHFAEQYQHIRPVPTGDVYQDVLARYFISSPTMMVRNEVLQRLNGYDEKLAYEDFDFWVRSARHYKYAYLNICTTLVRKSGKSMSRQLYRTNDRQLHSTYLVCVKASRMIRSSAEKRALAQRILYEAKHAAFSANFSEASLFLNLMERLKIRPISTNLLKILIATRLNLSVFHRWYSKRQNDGN